jgi:hypothetical protein
MSIFEKSGIDEKGNKIDLIITGTTFVGEKQEAGVKAEVDPMGSKAIIDGIDLESKYGWKRNSVIHTHPGYNLDFSDTRSDDGTRREGDIPFAIFNRVDVFVITKSYNFIKRFDIERYFNENPGGYDGPVTTHNNAVYDATDKRYIYIQK